MNDKLIRLKDLEEIYQNRIDGLMKGKPSSENVLMAGTVSGCLRIARELVELVDAKPVIHAHWEDCVGVELNSLGVPAVVAKKRCSHCKETNKNYTPPYCPHCGATMDEEVSANA